MFSRLGRFCLNHPWQVCAGWLVVAIVTTMLAPDWRRQTQDDDIRFLPPRYASVRGFQLLEESFPQDVFASRLLFALERADGPLTRRRFRSGRSTGGRLERPGPDAAGAANHRRGVVPRTADGQPARQCRQAMHAGATVAGHAVHGDPDARLGRCRQCAGPVHFEGSRANAPARFTSPARPASAATSSRPVPTASKTRRWRRSCSSSSSCCASIARRCWRWCRWSPSPSPSGSRCSCWRWSR